MKAAEEEAKLVVKCIVYKFKLLNYICMEIYQIAWTWSINFCWDTRSYDMRLSKFNIAKFRENHYINAK